MKNGKNGIDKIDKIILQDDLQYEGVTVLSYKIEYPVFSSSIYRKSLMVLNNYYKTRALDYQEYCRTKFYQMAVKQYLDSIKNGYPIRVFEAQDTYNITYNKARIISLYYDRYEFQGGAHGMTIRSSQTWDLQVGKMLRLAELFACLFNYKEYIISNVIGQIEKEPEPYFENYEELVRKNFNTSSFYCTPQGLIVYFQQYDIAPYASGIREFLIPYGDHVQNPVKRCRGW